MAPATQKTKSFFARQQTGDSVLIWGAMSYSGLSNLVIVSQKMNSEVCCEGSEEGLLRFSESKFEKTYILSRDSAPCQKSAYTIDEIEGNDVYLLPWLIWTPDLNSIENV